jgi:predicted TPR repeat methyltransferase
VFDETLRGWLTVCGSAPADALAAARACGQLDPKVPLDAARLTFDRGLDAPALALSQGWPIILGFIWGLLGPLLEAAALAFLLHAAACGFAERFLFRIVHPRALRAWRLAMMRLSVIAVLGLLFLAVQAGWRADPAFVRWATAGLAGTAVMAILVHRLFQGMRAFRVWRQRRAAPPTPIPPEPADAPLPEAPPAPFSTQTSGDILADRRYAYGDGALADGDVIAARDLFAQTLERVPQWPPAHLAHAKAALALGDQAEAEASLRRVLALDPADRLGAGVLLAQIGAQAPVMPPAYVAGLFDDYAPRFEGHLVAALDYRAPELLVAMLRRARGEAMMFASVLDLGCGTGLMATALRDHAGAMTGVDLSAGMLGIAEAGGLYRRLVAADLLGFLASEDAGCHDLVLAADVFCYVPDLAPVLAGAFRVLVPGGLFAFSIQTHPGAGVVMGADSRIHHAPAVVRDWAVAAGFEIREEVVASTRQDRGVPVPGALFLLARP